MQGTLPTAGNRMRRKWITALCLLCALSAGCATTHQVLIEHPKRVVRYPAIAGEVVGEIAGIPVAIVCLPATLLIAACNQDSEIARWAPLYPYSITRDAITTLIGGGPWLICGWWGVPKSELVEKIDVSPRWPRGTYVETPTGSIVVGDPSTQAGEPNENDR